MSYDIIYNKQFVRLRKTREVIPVLLAGSNNCFEIGYNGRNGRRAREWCSMRFYNRKGKVSEKPEIIIKNLDAELRRLIRRHQGDGETRPRDIRNHFGYYASIAVSSGHPADTSWNKYRSQFVNGIKGALTIEALHRLGVHLHFDAFSMNPDGKPDPIPLATEQQYFAELKKWRQWQAEAGSGFYLSFKPADTDVVLERLRAPKRRLPGEKTRVDQNHYFTLTDGSVKLVKYTSRGYMYTYAGSGKKFRTEKDAETYRKRLLARGSYKADIWRVKRVDSPCSFLI